MLSYAKIHANNTVQIPGYEKESEIKNWCCASHELETTLLTNSQRIVRESINRYPANVDRILQAPILGNPKIILDVIPYELIRALNVKDPKFLTSATTQNRVLSVIIKLFWVKFH